MNQFAYIKHVFCLMLACIDTAKHPYVVVHLGHSISHLRASLSTTNSDIAWMAILLNQNCAGCSHVSVMVRLTYIKYCSISCNRNATFSLIDWEFVKRIVMKRSIRCLLAHTLKTLAPSCCPIGSACLV